MKTLKSKERRALFCAHDDAMFFLEPLVVRLSIPTVKFLGTLRQ
jgi:hypothetical protein